MSRLADLGGKRVGLREFLDRYGVSLAVVAAVTLVLVLLPGNAPDATDVGAGSGGDASPLVGSGEQSVGGDLVGAGDAGALAGATTADADGSAGAGSSSGTGSVSEATTPGTSGGGGTTPAGEPTASGPCRDDGRMPGISRYMPPCRYLSGGNGGATARGVTGDRVLVVRYLAQLDPGTQAILEGARLADDPETIERAYRTLFRYSNQHYQTYGREVVFVDYRASGPSENDEAMKADAVKIAQDIRPFAVIDGNPAAPLPNVLARELAQRGVVCLCTTTLSSQFYNELPPYIWSSLPTSTEYAVHVAEFIGKRLAGRDAVHAGDELNPTQGFRSTPRKFGLIYLEGARGKVDPEGKRARDALVGELAKYGVRFSAEVGYIYDPGRNQQDVTNMIATMKAAGVTTVVPLWDPLYPILITQEATRQQYFPEWFVTGTGLSDTTTGGRLYDQQQWRHAFGVSPLWVTWQDVRRSAGYREYHHGAPGSSPGDEGVLINIYRARIESLFRGIHMAGPTLTPDTFAQGMVDFPATGGSAGLPLVFLTRAFPTDIKDFTEVWWDADRQGPDERGEVGAGMMMKVDGGRRYRPGEWPTTESKAFVDAGAVAISNAPEGGSHPDHEQDGHTHDRRCASCPD